MGIADFKSGAHSSLFEVALIWPALGGKMSNIMAFFPTKVWNVRRFRPFLVTVSSLFANRSRLMVLAILDLCYGLHSGHIATMHSLTAHRTYLVGLLQSGSNYTTRETSRSSG
jgi:hypothetical protein